MRVIKVMADYQCFPLWEASPGEVGNINPDSLPISQGLKDRLLAWAYAFDATLNMDYPPDSAFENDEVEAVELWDTHKALVRSAHLSVKRQPSASAYSMLKIFY